MQGEGRATGEGRGARGFCLQGPVSRAGWVSLAGSAERQLAALPWGCAKCQTCCKQLLVAVLTAGTRRPCAILASLRSRSKPCPTR